MQSLTKQRNLNKPSILIKIILDESAAGGRVIVFLGELPSLLVEHVCLRAAACEDQTSETIRPGRDSTCPTALDRSALSTIARQSHPPQQLIWHILFYLFSFYLRLCHIYNL